MTPADRRVALYGAIALVCALGLAALTGGLADPASPDYVPSTSEHTGT